MAALRRFIGALASRGWFEARTLCLLLLVFACLFGFAQIADEVWEGETKDFDHTVLDALRVNGEAGHPRGPHWLLASARDLSALGGVTVLTLLTLVVLGLLALLRRWRRFGVLLAATVGATILNQVMKKLFDRDRPEFAYHLVEVGNQSFPSGHAMLSAATYLTLGMLLASLVQSVWIKTYLLGAALSAVLLVGLTRIYLGVHYTTDVAAGWMIGAAWALLCALVAHRLGRQNDFAAQSSTPPA